MSSSNPLPIPRAVSIKFLGCHKKDDDKKVRQVVTENDDYDVSTSLTMAFGNFICSDFVQEWYLDTSLSGAHIVDTIKVIMKDYLEKRRSKSAIDKDTIERMIDKCHVMAIVGTESYVVDETEDFRRGIQTSMETTTGNLDLAFHLVPERMYRKKLKADFDMFDISHYTRTYELSVTHYEMELLRQSVERDLSHSGPLFLES